MTILKLPDYPDVVTKIRNTLYYGGYCERRGNIGTVYPVILGPVWLPRYPKIRTIPNTTI